MRTSRLSYFPSKVVVSGQLEIWIAVFGLAFISQLIFVDSLWIDELWVADLRGGDVFPNLFFYDQFIALPDATKEIISTFYGFGGALQIILRSAISDTSPPAYYLLMYAWTSMAGVSELALRTPSLLFQFGSLFLIIRIMRAAGTHEASYLLLGVILASPLQLYVAIDARPYAMYQFFIVLYLYLMQREIQSKAGSWRRSVGICISATIAVYTHYMACIFVMASVLSLLLCVGSPLLKRPSWRLWTPAVISGLLFIPWLPALALQASKEGRLGYLSSLDPPAIADPFYWCGPFSSFGVLHEVKFGTGLCTLVIWLASCVWLWRNKFYKSKHSTLRWLIGLQACVILLIFLVSLVRPVYTAKNFSLMSALISLPILFAAFQISTNSFRFALHGVAITLLVATCSLASMGRNYSRSYLIKPDWKNVAQFIQTITDGTHTILITPAHSRSPFMYYYRQNGYSIDLTRAHMVLDSSNVKPIYDFNSKMTQQLHGANGDNLIVIDASDVGPSLWIKQGFTLIQKMRGVKIFVSNN